MRDVLHAVVGEVTLGEVLLVGLVFALILLYSRAPRIGAAIGSLFQRDEP